MREFVTVRAVAPGEIMHYTVSDDTELIHGFNATTGIVSAESAIVGCGILEALPPSARAVFACSSPVSSDSFVGQAGTPLDNVRSTRRE